MAFNSILYISNSSIDGEEPCYARGCECPDECINDCVQNYNSTLMSFVDEFRKSSNDDPITKWNPYTCTNTYDVPAGYRHCHFRNCIDYRVDNDSSVENRDYTGGALISEFAYQGRTVWKN